MRWIDKSNNRAYGLRNTCDFLNNHCLENDGRFRGIRYNDNDPGTKETFCLAQNSSYRKRLTQLLLSEQNDMCCYCLRRLKTNQDEQWSYRKITLEHIIPRSFSSGPEAAYYQTAPGLTPQDVVLTDLYESTSYNQQTSIHPHKIAYNNIVASCNGTFPEKTNINNGRQKICCNLKRSNLQAYPVYFFKDVADWIDYLPDGDVQAVYGTPEESHVRTLIANTNLQCDSLKEIRYLWYLLRNKSEQEIYACNASESKRLRLLGDVLFGYAVSDRSVNLLQKYIKKDYWDTLILYNKFYEIMRVKYPQKANNP